MYAKLGAASVPEPNHDGSIIEDIYTVPSLHPDSFTHKPSPEGGQSSENDLCPYSSIYTVPVLEMKEKSLSVTADNMQKVKVLGSGNN